MTKGRAPHRDVFGVKLNPPWLKAYHRLVNATRLVTRGGGHVRELGHGLVELQQYPHRPAIVRRRRGTRYDCDSCSGTFQDELPCSHVIALALMDGVLLRHLLPRRKP